MDTYATAVQLARIYNRSLSTIRHWAHEDGWRRTATRPVRYSWHDAQASYDRRNTRHGTKVLDLRT